MISAHQVEKLMDAFYPIQGGHLVKGSGTLRTKPGALEPALPPLLRLFGAKFTKRVRGMAIRRCRALGVTSKRREITFHLVLGPFSKRFQHGLFAKFDGFGDGHFLF